MLAADARADGVGQKNHGKRSARQSISGAGGTTPRRIRTGSSAALSVLGGHGHGGGCGAGGHGSSKLAPVSSPRGSGAPPLLPGGSPRGAFGGVAASKAAKLRKLNASMSLSVATVWSKRRPATGETGVPEFSPRCCAVLCCAVLCCAVPCCAVLCCAILCYTVLCYTVLYYAARFCTALHCTALY